MNTELAYRIAVLLLFVGFIAHRGYYSRKLKPSADNTLKQREATPASRLANLLSLPGFAAVLLYIIHPDWMAWAALPLPAWLRWLGAGLAFAGFALLQWSQQILGRNWSDTPRLMKDQRLVTDGPYQWVRHPIYTAFLLILSAPLLLSANWFIGLTWIGMTALDVMSRVRFEEALMLETFGEPYQAYMKRTGRFFPRLGL
jgi:protein-S-isoprenylcysteine O-methyltransferase Ste14